MENGGASGEGGDDDPGEALSNTRWFLLEENDNFDVMDDQVRNFSKISKICFVRFFDCDKGEIDCFSTRRTPSWTPSSTRATLPGRGATLWANFFFKKKSENQSKIRIWTGLHPLAVPPLPDPAACLPPPDGAADRPGHCPHRGGPGHRLPGRPHLQGHLVRRSGEEEAVGAGGVSASCCCCFHCSSCFWCPVVDYVVFMCC